MKILVINAGSSSLKYQLIDTDNEAVLAKGNCERIGQNGAFIGFKTPDGKKINRKTQMLNHTQAFEAVKDALIDPEYGAISDLSEVSAVGHRVVQGGAYFDKSVLVNNSVINKIRELAPLAPLHNLAHLQGIEACTRVFGTTMGLTPLGGFMMGTRSGSLDPSVITFIAEKEHLTPEEMSKILNKESGLLGISGVSSDDRDVCAAEADGNMRAHLAHEMLYYQIAKYIGSYYVALGGCDGIVFTAGIGENQPMLREKVCDYLECLGVKMDKEFNKQATCGVTGTLSTPDSAIRVELIATDEEMVIARDTRAIVEAL